jgi:HD-GYP domain-containing protein (c-di-GMP phosphodiesterase class II)
VIRLIVTRPPGHRRVQQYNSDTVAIGRSPDNDLCLTDPRVSSHHGRFAFHGGKLYYQDLGSTNGSSLVRPDGHEQRIEPGAPGHLVGNDDVIQVATCRLAVDFQEPALAQPKSGDHLTVILSRPQATQQEESRSLELNQGLLFQFLSLVRQTSASLRDQKELTDSICAHLLTAFPTATHVAIVTREVSSGRLRPVASKSRAGDVEHVPLSRTIVQAVLEERTALLFSRGDPSQWTVSAVSSGIETAICAPLCAHGEPFGVVQLDIRHAAAGVFTSEDVDRLVLFANHVGLVLSDLRFHQERQHAFESTIAALLHSLTLKDPDTAHHCERVQAASVCLGTELGLGGVELEVLRLASLLHDLGKQGVRDEILFKAGTLTPEEREEIGEHASHTEDILNKIAWPDDLRQVPVVAAYHHERMDGKGTYRIPGEQIPIQARIIAVADCFDALASARAYKTARTYPEILSMLEEGRGAQWDPRVLDALRTAGGRFVREVYGTSSPMWQSYQAHAGELDLAA